MIEMNDLKNSIIKYFPQTYYSNYCLLCSRASTSSINSNS